MLLGRVNNGFLHTTSAFVCWRCRLHRPLSPPFLATYATKTKTISKSRRRSRLSKPSAASGKSVKVRKLDLSDTPLIRKLAADFTLPSASRRKPSTSLASRTSAKSTPRLRTLREVLATAKITQIENHDSGQSIAASKLEFKPLDVPVPAIPKLGYGLQRALFNAGVIQLRDLHTRVYNFDPYLEKLIPVKEFDFNTLPTFTPSSKDPILRDLTRSSGKRYFGSTSSTTGVLAHFHFLLSRWRNLNTDMLPKDTPCYQSFTKISRAPAVIFLRWNEEDQTYAIDADKEFDSANVLSMMGRYMEKLLTMDKSEFELHRRENSHLLRKEDMKGPDAYHYSTLENIVIRSQLDAHDSRLPGTGMFDLKTRAVLPIRMDSANFEWGMKYEIRQLHGEWESYAREYADMLRSTLLKYSLQARMGRMDGIFVAYHNIARIFGVQYIPLKEMDIALHGQEDGTLGDQEFMTSLRLLSEVFDKVTGKFPKQSLRIHFETRETVEPFMYIFAEPVTEPQIETTQARSKERIEKWEQEMLGMRKPAEHESILENIQDVENDKQEDQDTSNTGPLFGMQLYVKSFVNEKAVQRPSALGASDKWKVNFSMKEMEKENRLRSLYDMCKARRKAELEDAPDETNDDYFIKKIKEVTEKSSEWREERDRLDAQSASKVRYWNEDMDMRWSTRVDRVAVTEKRIDWMKERRHQNQRAAPKMEDLNNEVDAPPITILDRVLKFFRRTGVRNETKEWKVPKSDLAAAPDLERRPDSPRAKEKKGLKSDSVMAAKVERHSDPPKAKVRKGSKSDPVVASNFERHQDPPKGQEKTEPNVDPMDAYDLETSRHPSKVEKEVESDMTRDTAASLLADKTPDVQEGLEKPSESVNELKHQLPTEQLKELEKANPEYRRSTETLKTKIRTAQRTITRLRSRLRAGGTPAGASDDQSRQQDIQRLIEEKQRQIATIRQIVEARTASPESPQSQTHSPKENLVNRDGPPQSPLSPKAVDENLVKPDFPQRVPDKRSAKHPGPNISERMVLQLQARIETQILLLEGLRARFEKEAASSEPGDVKSTRRRSLLTSKIEQEERTVKKLRQRVEHKIAARKSTNPSQEKLKNTA